MSHTSVGPWSSGDELTSAQIGAIDTSVTNSYDIRSGQTNTVQSVTTLTGAGRIIPNYEVGANADTTYALSSGITVIDAKSASLSADRAYTLSNTGAAAGDTVWVIGNATYNVQVKNNGGTRLITVGQIGDTSSNVVGSTTWAEFRHDGTNWQLARSANPGPRVLTAAFQPTLYHSTAATTGSSPPLALKPYTATEVTYSGSAFSTATVNTGSSASYYYYMPLGPDLIPNGQTLSSIVATVQGAGHSSLPQQMPALAVVRYDGATAANLLSSGNGWATDSSGTTGAFDAAHSITYTPNSSQVFDHYNFTYGLYFLGEGGSNAIAGLVIKKLVLTLTA